MKKKLFAFPVLVMLIVVMTGCCTSHTWIDATCTEPKTCSNCGKTEGEALGHKKGDWELIAEPQGGEPGTEARLCTVCDESLEEKDFLYPYFDMSFEKFMNIHNNTYKSMGCEIRETNKGFSFYMNGKEMGLVFNDDLNMRKEGTMTAYSTVKEEKFNELIFRMIDSGASNIDDDMLTYTLLFGGMISQPLTDSELDSFIDDFVDNWVVKKNSSTYFESEVVIDGYKYVLNAYSQNLGIKQIIYNFACYPEY